MMNPNYATLWGQALHLNSVLIKRHVQTFYNNMEVTAAINNSFNGAWNSPGLLSW